MGYGGFRGRELVFHGKYPGHEQVDEGGKLGTFHSNHPSCRGKKGFKHTSQDRLEFNSDNPWWAGIEHFGRERTLGFQYRDHAFGQKGTRHTSHGRLGFHSDNPWWAGIAHYFRRERLGFLRGHLGRTAPGTAASGQ